MRAPLDEARERAATALADARRGLSLLDGPLTAAKQRLARKRLQAAGEGLAVVWLALGQIEPEAPFTKPPRASLPPAGGGSAQGVDRGASGAVVDFPRRRRHRPF